MMMKLNDERPAAQQLPRQVPMQQTVCEWRAKLVFKSRLSRPWVQVSLYLLYWYTRTNTYAGGGGGGGGGGRGGGGGGRGRGRGRGEGDGVFSFGVLHL